jgi:GNAT superfamily N-acetyltransferase
MTVWPGPSGYWVSDDSSSIDVSYVHEWLTTESYWAKGRPRPISETAVANSLNFGLFHENGKQVGFCRWVTDGATFAWLCDVFVDPGHRGHGLGVFLIEVATSHPKVQDLRLLLGTADAHELYRKFGFTAVSSPERLMEIRKGGVPPAP